MTTVGLERREREGQHRHQRRARRDIQRDALHALEREVAPDDRVLPDERLDLGLHLLLPFGREELRADLERVLFEEIRRVDGDRLLRAE